MAYVSSGTTFSVSALAVMTAVGDVTAITFDGINVAELDTGDISSAVKSFITGNKDNGTVSVSLNLWTSVGATMDAQYYLRPALYKAGASPGSFEIRFGGAGAGSTVAFQAYVTSLNVSAAVDSVVTAEITLRISSALTWTG
jgi:hypothetical protein